jgi:hypothetical protein
MSRRALVLLLSVALPAALPAEESVPQDDTREVFPRVLKLHGDAMVRMRFVSNISMGGREDQQEGQAIAMLVSADGLLLVADHVVRPQVPRFGGPGMPALEMKSSDFRVRLARSDRDLEAALVARDTDLGLAWFRLTEPQKDLPHVDLERRGELAIGDVYYSVTRVGQALGGVAVVAHGIIVGETETPVPALLALGPVDAAFDAEGRFVGFTARNFVFDPGAQLFSNGVLPQPMIQAARVARATARAAKLEPQRDSE